MRLCRDAEWGINKRCCGGRTSKGDNKKPPMEVVLGVNQYDSCFSLPNFQSVSRLIDIVLNELHH